MMTLHFIKRLFLLIWMSGALAGLSTGASTSDQSKSAPSEPDFSGKILAIYTGADGGSSGVIIEKVQAKRLGNRTFLCGRVVEIGTSKNPAAGLVIWVSAEEIARMWEFKDLQEAQKYYRAQLQAAEPARSPPPIRPTPSGQAPNGEVPGGSK
jgi:hypothetical protein